MDFDNQKVYGDTSITDGLVYLRNVQVSSLCMVRLIFYRWTLFPTLVCLKLGTILIKVLVQLIV